MTNELNQIAREQVLAHLTPAWSTVVRALQLRVDRGEHVGSLALVLIDGQAIPFDEKRAAECRSRGGFSDGQTTAEVRPLAEVVKLAAGMGPMALGADQFTPPSAPSALIVYAITLFGPCVATVTYDPDALVPTIGDA